MRQNPITLEDLACRARRRSRTAIAIGLVACLGIAAAAKWMIDRARAEALQSTNRGRLSQILYAAENALERNDRCLFDRSGESPWKISLGEYIEWAHVADDQCEIAPIFFPDRSSRDRSDIFAICISSTESQRCCDSGFYLICSDIPELQFAPRDAALLSRDEFIAICAASRVSDIARRPLIVARRGKSTWVTTVGEFSERIKRPAVDNYQPEVERNSTP